MKDNEIIESIRMGNREKPIKYLYQEFPKIKANIFSSGGDVLIAEEIFNDSLLLLIEKVESESFVLTSKLSTYLYGIARMLWKNELRKRNKNQELEWTDTLILSEKEFGYDYEKEARLQAMENVLASLSEKCQSIFQLFYYKKQSMATIAKALGFTSINSAKTQKYKCIERASKLADSSVLL